MYLRSLHIAAVSGSNMSMEKGGSEVLDFAQHAAKVPVLVPQDTRAWVMMDDDEFQC